MTKKQLLKKIRLSDSDLNDICQAVKNAEKNTSGEIALALAPESDTYNFWELLFSVYFGALISLLLLVFSSPIEKFITTSTWIQESQTIPTFYIAAAFFSVAAGFLIMNIPFIDRLIIPGNFKAKAVSKRALLYFCESGVYKTKEHSGILIYVSWLEKEVRILADTGISSKISQDFWDDICKDFTIHMKNGNAKTAFINAVSKCGELLSEKFPAGDENPDELSDGLVILEN